MKEKTKKNTVGLNIELPRDINEQLTELKKTVRLSKANLIIYLVKEAIERGLANNCITLKTK